MSVYGGPDIITDGLVLHLDAANRKSYPGSGSTWYDLSGNAYDGTIRNSTTFTNTNGGELNFDAADEEIWATVNGVNTTSGEYNTVEFWMYWNGNDSGFPMEFSSARLWKSNSADRWGFNRGSGDIYGISNATSKLANAWKHIVAIFYNGVQTNNSLYINNIQETLSQQQGSSGTVSASSQVTIAGYRGNNSYAWYGKMALFKIYNRALSADEISRNYNATKGRYGL